MTERLPRGDYSLGWYPDADPIKGPPTAVPRMDNLVLDEEGILSLRKGSSTLHTLTPAQVRSLYTTYLNGVKKRFATAGGVVYCNGSQLMTGLTEDNYDCPWGSMLGQVFFSGIGTNQRKKYDGSTVRNWGIAKPTGAVTAAALAADYKVFATCDSSESPGFVATEGTVTFVTGQDGVANHAVQLTASSSTARGCMTKTFAAETDYTAYVGGGNGTDDDLVDFYCYITDPASITSITLMIDCNGNSVNPFQDDYYAYQFEAGLETDVRLSEQEFLDSDFDAEGFDRYRIREQLEARKTSVPVVTFRVDQPIGNAGWNHFSVPRGKFVRIGNTSGKDWRTIKAIRLVFTCTSATSAVLAFDQIQIMGGDNRPLTGTYRYRVVGVYNNGVYEAKSVVSDATASINLKAQGVQLTLSSAFISSLDSQVNELWVYRMGGYLDRFYRVAVKTGGPFSGQQTIDDTTSDRKAMLTNTVLESDLVPPPSIIKGIAGPHFFRLFILTPTHLYISKRNNPDGYAYNHVAKIAGLDETCLWICQAQDCLWIGTTRDIYRVAGDFAENPDGTLNMEVRGVGIGNPPLNEAIAQEGDLICYLAADGWRQFTGHASTSLLDGVRTLYAGTSWTRNGVSYVTMSLAARTRAAVAKGVLSAITGEAGAGAGGAPNLYRRDFRRGVWYRHTYPTTFTSIHTEPDGLLIAGTSAGLILQLDTGNQDNSVDIPVVLWSRCDDLNLPLNKKQPVDLQFRIDTYQNQATVKVHLDASDSAAKTITMTVPGAGVHVENVEDLAICRLLQWRLTGSFSTFKLYHSAFGFWAFAPETVVWDTGPLDLGDDLIWIRAIDLKINAAADVYIIPYFDDVSKTPKTVTVTANKTKVYRAPFYRGLKGAAPRIHVTSNSPFQPLWMDIIYSSSGRVTEKMTRRIAA